MNRRDLLTSLGAAGTAGIAGCIGTSDSEPSEESYPEGKQRRVTLAGQDTVSDGHELSLNIEVRRALITHAETAHLRVRATNEGQTRGISFTETDKCALFNRSKGLSDEPQGLILRGPSDAEQLELPENQWVRDLPSDKVRSWDTYGCSIETIESGAAFTNEYHVWDDYQTEEYLEPGTYRWEEQIRLTDPPQSNSPDMRAEFTWGFSLTLERVEP